MAAFTVYADDGEDSESDADAVEAALSSCAEAVISDSSGQPDVQAMDSCMSDKGFSRPMGGPVPGQDSDNSNLGGEGSGDHGGHPPPHHRNTLGRDCWSAGLKQFGASYRY